MKKIKQEQEQQTERIRLDQWLWAARFFKTRSLAVAAINGGKVRVQDQRAKPGRAVHLGDQVKIQKEGLIWEVEICALVKQRRPASEAVLLYQENETSAQRRQAFLDERRLHKSLFQYTSDARPTKRNRRQIERFVEQNLNPDY